MTALVFGLAALAAGGGPAEPWDVQPAVTAARLRGVSAAGESVWASGTGGTFVRSADGGRTWAAGVVPGAEGLDFRDVHAFDARSAVLLTCGPGDQSRIYATRDGGSTWSLRHTNPDPAGFLDAIAFRDDRNGLAFGDPVAGRFTILATDDGGASWERLPADLAPEALPGEGAFAASGTCLVVSGDRDAWIATGGVAQARVFRSTDGGRTWAAHPTPLPAGSSSSGVFSLAFGPDGRGVAVGGDYTRPQADDGVAATTSDGGLTWTPVATRGPSGYRSAVVRLDEEVYLTVGPSGSDLSRDGGRTWTRLGRLGFHAVADGGSGTWAVGDEGRVARLVLPPPGR